jgi:hypothetical protein
MSRAPSPWRASDALTAQVKSSVPANTIGALISAPQSKRAAASPHH